MLQLSPSLQVPPLALVCVQPFGTVHASNEHVLPSSQLSGSSTQPLILSQLEWLQMSPPLQVNLPFGLLQLPLTQKPSIVHASPSSHFAPTSMRPSQLSSLPLHVSVTGCGPSHTTVCPLVEQLKLPAQGPSPHVTEAPWSTAQGEQVQIPLIGLQAPSLGSHTKPSGQPSSLAQTLEHR